MLHFGDAIGEHFSAFNFLPIILYFVLMLINYLIFNRRFYFLSVCVRKSRINSFSISGSILVLSFLIFFFVIAYVSMTFWHKKALLMYILHQEGYFFYCPFFTELFKYEGGLCLKYSVVKIINLH